MIKKMFLTPWFGDLPSWFDKYINEMQDLEKYGYYFFFPTDLDDFNKRCEKVLGFPSSIKPGSGKLHDYRCALGELYAEELEDFEFWGHTDFDCVYGDISKFEPDLSKLDIWSNHHNYICGPWTIYKNVPEINNLYRRYEGWENIMKMPASTGWVEKEYTQVVDAAHAAGEIRRLYTFYQGHDPNIDTNLTKIDGRLYDGKDEIMTFHFNRHKRWPLK